MMVAGIWGGLAMAFLYGALAVRGGPNWFLLAWPALFVSLGIQFVRAAIEGPAAGYSVTAALFLAMGGGPVVVALFTSRRALWHTLVGNPADYVEPDDGPVRRSVITFTAAERARLHAGAQRALASRRRAEADRQRPRDGQHRPTRPGGAIVDSLSAAAPHDVADALDRVATLHRQGLVSEEEFAAAKRRILDLGDPS